jgi:hypothetical protein
MPAGSRDNEKVMARAGSDIAAKGTDNSRTERGRR